MTQPIRDLASLQQARAAMAGRVALVPTMGALHEGHLQLVAEARKHADYVIASIYVNPMQFGDSADLARYPRDEAGDLAALTNAGCDLAWLPSNAIMYPPGCSTVVEPGGPAEGLEGAGRPGHFQGVATVVAKLFGQTRPDIALFGEKDWQQLQVIRRMAEDLFLPVTVAGVPTAREADGLAMSSRNRFLDPTNRALAGLLPVTLKELTQKLTEGASISATLAAARATLQKGGLQVDYLAVVDAETVTPAPVLQAGMDYRLLAAARLGSLRLLDNFPLRVAGT